MSDAPRSLSAAEAQTRRQARLEARPTFAQVAREFVAFFVDPRRSFFRSLVAVLLPFVILEAWKFLFNPFDTFALEDSMWWSFTWTLLINPGAWFLLPTLVIAGIVAPKLRVLAGTTLGAMVGAGLGFSLSFGCRDLAREHFAERTQPFVAAFDRYTFEKGAPPPTFEALVPDYLDALPRGLPNMAYTTSTTDAPQFELELVCRLFAHQILVLRSSAQRGTHPTSRSLEDLRNYGAWEVFVIE